MKSIHEYITNDMVIDILCNMRVRIAEQIHKKELINSLANQSNKCDKLIDNNSELFSLLPNRKSWKTLKKEFRHSKSSQVISTHKKNVLRLKITISHYRKMHPMAQFLVNLDSFIQEVRYAFRNKDYKILSPITYAVAKQGTANRNSKIECRPISMYSRLLDKVVIKIANRYMSELFDPYFCHRDSLAFRAKRCYYGSDVFTTHHHAVDRINAFRKKYNSRNIYVSECDIKKFYDSVDHAVVKRQFKYFLGMAKKDHPNIDTISIKRIFIGYLNSFSFSKDVFSKNDDTAFWEGQRIPNGCFEWINKDLIENGYYTKRTIKNAKIGVPQGGAISGLIANMVLDAADKNVKDHLTKRMLYIRYCDDMILLSTNKSAAEKVTTIFINTLTSDLRLIPHKPVAPSFHDRTFWKEKSKHVYKWDINCMAAPWIGFVGYEFRRTGEIRIRKKSLIKEKDKQREVFLKIVSISQKETCKSKGTLLESLSSRLLGMSVGRVSMWNYRNFHNELCWISGFEKLIPNQYSASQIKQLDRNRSRYLFLAIKKIKVMKELEDSRQANSIVKAKRVIPQYYGLPYSYYFHYVKV